MSPCRRAGNGQGRGQKTAIHPRWHRLQRARPHSTGHGRGAAPRGPKWPDSHHPLTKYHQFRLVFPRGVVVSDPDRPPSSLRHHHEPTRLRARLPERMRHRARQRSDGPGGLIRQSRRWRRCQECRGCGRVWLVWVGRVVLSALVQTRWNLEPTIRRGIHRDEYDGSLIPVGLVPVPVLVLALWVLLEGFLKRTRSSPAVRASLLETSMLVKIICTEYN